MGVVAELGRLAIGAWSPDGAGGGYIASATYEAADTSFTSDPKLELVSVDIAQSKLSVISEVSMQERFTSIDWSPAASRHPAGLIAGGLTDGTVRVWDAATLIRSSKGNDPNRGVLFGSPSAPKKHSNAVRALEFHPIMRSRLASGGADANILLWDLTNPSAGPNVRHLSGQPAKPQGGPREEVTAVTWNRKVSHILGSATTWGVMSVWDLRQSKQVFSIRNPRGRLPCSSLAWHPENATQVVIATDNEDSTGALLWDLRNASSPLMTFAHHSPKGVVSCSWSNHDADLLLTSSRDSRTVVVSVSTGEIVSESPKSSNWNFDVKWSPRIPGMYMCSSFDGRLSVNSMLTADTAPSVSSEAANALAESFGEAASGFQNGMIDHSTLSTELQKVSYHVARPPRWFKRPCGLSFGFGGVQASLIWKEQRSTVAIKKFEEGLNALPKSSNELDDFLLDITADDPSPAREWCEKASASAETPNEKMVWDALGMMFQTDARRKLLRYLGFEAPPPDAGDEIAMPVYGLVRSHALAVPVRPVEEVSTAINEEKLPGGSQTDAIVNGTNRMNLDGPAPWDIGGDAGDDLNAQNSILDGDDTATGQEELPSSKQNGTSLRGVNGASSSSLADMASDQIDAVIKKALIVGDFRSAVDACLHIGRSADALVIAHAGGPELWQSCQGRYLAKASLTDGVSTVGAIAGSRSKMDEYIRHSAEAGKESWKEALAVLLTYTQGENLTDACTALGDRLLVKNNYSAALFCFICGGNTKKASSTWARERPAHSKATSAMMHDRVERLVALVGKVRLFATAMLLAQGEREIGTVHAMDDVGGSVLCEYGALLALSGNVSLAITYLNNLDGAHSCAYGSAADLRALAAESLAAADSVAMGTPTHAAVAPSYSGYGNAYQESTPNYASQSSYPQVGGGHSYARDQSTGGSWNSPIAPAMPSVPTPYTGNLSGVQSFMTPAPAAAPSVRSSPPPPQTAYSSHSGALERASYDLSAAYASAPAYNSTSSQSPTSYPTAPMPVPPPVGLNATASSPTQYSGSFPAAVPPPAMPPANSVVPPGPFNSVGGYGHNLPPSGPRDFTSAPGMAPQQMTPQPPPPPPPPSDSSAPPPSSYHANARPGSGSALPPSAEIAVAQTRRLKPLSSSGTPGGPPRRTNSTSSSLSAMGIETVLLEKADTSKVPDGQQVIVKSLRGSYMYARSRNEAPRYKKKMDDVSKRLGKLVAALNNGLLDSAVVDLLTEFGQAVEKGNYNEAGVVVSKLTRHHWDSNSQWIQGLKRLIDCVLTGR